MVLYELELRFLILRLNTSRALAYYVFDIKGWKYGCI